MNPGSVYFAQQDRLMVLKLVGAIRIASREACRLSAGLERFVQQLAGRKDIDGVLIDLNEATMIDSTNLGLLAQIAQLSRTRWNRRPTIVSTNEDINTTLESIGFDEVFIIIKAVAPPGTEWQTVPDVTASELDQVRLMLDAHRALIAISPENLRQFRNVIELLDQELSNRMAPSSKRA